MPQKKLCLHCDPYSRSSSHIPEKLELLLFPIFSLFSPLERLLQRSSRFNLAINRMIFGGFLKTLLAFKILRESDAQDHDDGLYNRSLVIVREARKRGITVKSLRFLGKGTNHFSIKTKGVKEFFEGFPYFSIEYVSSVDFDDKGRLKELLEKEDVPHPQGRSFRDYLPALLYVRSTLGFPVVVKPRRGSLSRHTTCNIQNENQLQEAVKVVKIISREFVVEEFIEGNVYRVTMVNGDLVAACFREQSNVIGDAKHTIRELIEIKNKNPDRGEMHQKNFTLHKIIISERVNLLLSSQDLKLNSVLPRSKKVYLHDKVVLACGADIHDVTDEIHPENRILFKKVYELCKAPLIGIDFIARDISKSYHKQKSAVIEVNSMPYIDMHHYPVTGKARNVASHVLDYFSSIHKISQ